MEATEIRDRLTRLIQRCRVFEAIPAQRLHDAEDMVRHNEALIALENLCTHLDDADVDVPPDVLDEIRQLGGPLRLADTWWRMLTPEQRRLGPVS
jgi:hypothetical protein